MSSATQYPAEDPPKSERPRNASGGFSSEAVLGILNLILAGSELSEVLTIIAGLVESQGNGTLCTIWLPDADGKHVYCAAAPIFPGFAINAGRMSVGPKGGSCGTAVYRREPVYVANIVQNLFGTIIATACCLTVFAPFGRALCSRVKARSSGRSRFTIVKCAIPTLTTCR